jgi:enoyl-CoA hydratase/carnithine racemase
LARSAADGSVEFPPMPSGPMETPDQLADVELGHLSQVTDGILVRAIVEGCRQPLSEGLRFESEMFAECCRTQDMKIGVTNFMKNGPKAKAEFVHG